MSKKRNRSLLKKFFFVVFLLFFCVSVASVFSYTFFIPKDPLFVSPAKDGKMAAISKLEDLLLREKIEFSYVSIQPGFYSFEVSNNGEVLISSEKDVGKQVSSLQQLLKQLTIEGKRFKRIDFRFDKPIVVLQDKI